MFQVDKIVEQMMQFIYSYDLLGLRELWGHLDQKMFSKLESEFTPGKKIICTGKEYRNRTCCFK